MYRLAIPLLALSITGCASHQDLQRVSADDSPEWYQNLPVSTDDTLYAPASETSRDMQLAIDKAVAAARTGIAQEVMSFVEDTANRAREELGDPKDSELNTAFSNASRLSSKASLSGSRVLKQNAKQVDGGIWRAWVLVGYPTAPSKKAMSQEIKNNEHLYERFWASQLMQDLDSQMKKTDEREKQ